MCIRDRGTESMSQDEYRKAAVDAVKKLAEDVGIPKDLKDIVKEEDIPFLAESDVYKRQTIIFFASSLASFSAAFRLHTLRPP